MGKEKEKPAEILVAEFRARLVALVNTCGLPPFVAEMVIAEVHGEITALAKARYAEVKKAYEATETEGES